MDKRIIFVSKDGASREAMAAGILKDIMLHPEKDILARGLVVQFPGPLNQKAEAVLISNGIEIADFVSEQLTAVDITEDALLLTMEEREREHVLELFPEINPDQVQVLPFFVGEELEVVNPYGGNIQTYGLCFENLRKSIKKLVAILTTDSDVSSELSSTEVKGE